MEAENLEDMIWKYLANDAWHFFSGSKGSVSGEIVRDWSPPTGKTSRIAPRRNAGASIPKLFNATTEIVIGWRMQRRVKNRSLNLQGRARLIGRLIFQGR